MLSNACLLAKFRFDTAENEPCKAMPPALPGKEQADRREPVNAPLSPAPGLKIRNPDAAEIRSNAEVTFFHATLASDVTSFDEF